MATPNEIVKSEKADVTVAESFSAYIRRPEITEKFLLVMKTEQARRLIESVILLYMNADPVVRDANGNITSGEYSLQNCTYASIVRTALRAATQRVSVDPIDRQAWVIPNRNPKTGKIEAGLRIHYAETENRAWRTNRFQHINVSPIFEGTKIVENVLTGMLYPELDGGDIVSPGSATVFRSWNERDGKARIGWFGYFKTIRGREKTIYMSCSDIYKMLAKIPGYKMGSAWNNEHSKEIMEKKIVLVALLKQADLQSPEMAELKDAIESIDNAENDLLDSDPDLAALSMHDENAPELTGQFAEPDAEENEYLNACDVTVIVDGVETHVNELSAERFEYICANGKTEKKRAALIIKAWREKHPKKTEAQMYKELGFDPEPARKTPPPAVTPAAMKPAPVVDELDEVFPPLEDLRYSPSQLQDYITDLSKDYAAYDCSDKQVALMVSSLSSCVSGDEEKRHVIQFFLTGKRSTKDMAPGQIRAMLKWLNPSKDNAGKYWPDGMAVKEANAAYTAEMIAAGQQKLI